MYVCMYVVMLYNDNMYSTSCYHILFNLFVHVRSTFFYLCIHLAVVVPFQLKRYKRLKVYAFGAPYMMLCTFMYAF